jgi:hypothetical protein
MSLPSEIQLMIISHLSDHYHALRSLHDTHRHFARLVTPEQFRAALLSYELSRKETSIHYDHFPCYGCLRLLPRSSHWESDDANMIGAIQESLSDLGSMRRRCWKCDVYEGDSEFLKWLNAVSGGIFNSFLLCVCCAHSILSRRIPASLVYLRYTSSARTRRR